MQVAVNTLDHHMGEFARTQMLAKYSHKKHSGHKEEWHEIAYRTVSSVVGPYLPDLVDPITRLVVERKFMPGGRYLASAGRRYAQVNNCFLFGVHDSREGWADLMHDATASLMTGGGIGVVYSPLRAEGIEIKGMGGYSTGPCALAQIVNEAGRHIMQGGSRRSAIWAGLHWNHPDIWKFIELKNWPEFVRQKREEDFNFPAPMDGTNISVIVDDEFFAAFENPSHQKHDLANGVFWATVRRMLIDGEPGFSVDIGPNSGEHLRNACTEATSRDDGDMCNLSSWNLARFRNLDEFAEAQRLGVAFNVCGSLYSKLPVERMYQIREKNRRIGMGLMGVHEWLLLRNYRYEPNTELARWMDAYALSGEHAHYWEDRLGISRSVATKSVAPTGTISIVAETTSGIEPIYAVAYKRRYRSGMSGKDMKFQYVIDRCASRLINERNVDPSLIEDSTTLAEDVERRMAFQAWLQTYVDQGISSTINLPAWGTHLNNESTVQKFGNTLMKYLPKVRGITAYPDGSRGGQPLVRVPYSEAKDMVGVEFADHADQSCKSGVCSS